MPSSAENITNQFPFLQLTPIMGPPTYKTIRELNTQLSANAASIHSNLSDGKLGLVFLMVTPAVYATLSANAFNPPTNPGTTITLPDSPTGNQINTAN